MAGNEATSQTTLWSSVVHQPCEEPEDAELPSTVDMAAFSTGLTVEPPTNTTSQNIDNNNNNNSNNNNSNSNNNNNSNTNNRSESDSDSEVDSSNSGSEASQSCSQSDSSDTETTTSSIDTTTSRSPSPPEFSVTSTQTNGLRLTIATVRKSIGSPVNNKSNQNDIDDNIDNKSNKSGDYSSCSDTQCSTESDSDDDDDDDNTDHDDESNNKTKSNNTKCNKDSNLKRNLRSRSDRKDDKKINNRKETISPMKNPNLRSRNRPRKIRKMAASLPLSRGSTYSSSDTDESDADRAILASCSLQEIRQEDLAAILPDQQECDAFGDFDCSNSNNNRNSNNNSSNNNNNNNTNNSVNGGGIIDKNSPQVGDMSGSDMELPQQAVNALIQRTTESSSESESHPPPNPNTLYANSLLQQFVAQTQMLNAPCPIIPQTTNDGFNNNNKTLIGGCEIQNNTNNNTCNTSTTTSATNNNNNNNKNSNNNDKSTNNNSNNSHTKDLDIDLVKRKRGRPRKGDNSIKSSNDNKTSKSTINVDYCGDPNVSPDSGIQNSPDHHVSSPEPTILPTTNKIKTTSNHDNNDNKVNNKTIKTESKCDKITINNNNKKEINKLSVTSNRFDRLLYANTDRVLYPPRRKSNRPILKKGPGRPPKPKSINNGNNEVKLNEKNSENRGNDSGSSNSNKHQNNHKTKIDNKRPVLVAKNNKIDNMNIKYTTLKNLKLMHSKHKHKKHKKCKFKILKPVTTIDTNSETKIEIDKLINDFSKYCVIGSSINNNNSNTNNNKLPKENIPELPVKTVKKVSKKRKTAEYSERKKKKIHINATVSKITNNLNNEQRLPLKKRHYLYSDGKNNVKQIKDEDITTIDDEEKDTSTNNSTTTITVGTDSNSGNGGTSTTTTPKKRHRLEVVNSKEGSPCLTTETQKSKPKLSLENLICELKMKRNNNNNNNVVEVKCTTNEQELSQITTTKKDIKDNHEQLKQSSTDTVGNKKKIRKRRAINRTGFPTIKKKKKKLIVPVENEEIEEKPAIITTNNTTTTPTITCDRVPKDGEEYNKFIQRTEIDKITKCEDSLSSVTTNTTTTKWEILSECDSLPQDERELENENSNNTNCDLDEISLEASIERLRSRLDKKKRKRSNNNHNNNNNEKIIDVYPKRKLRDISPASSIEPLMERRLRDERASASGDELKKNNNRKIPRWRKKYLVAGLFSDYYKEDDETVRLKRNENITTKSRLIYKRDEHPYGLLPPPYHCGKYLRCRKIPFQLPYDLWWQHTHSQLPGRDIVPSWNYRKIRTNVYNVKLTTGACEPQACNCTSSSNCGDDCINRLVLAECPATHKCQNQRIQKHEWAPGLEKFMTESKGWGVRTKYPIKNGEFILEYVGEVVSDQEFKERMATIYINDQHHYCLHLDGGLVIDGHRMGGDGRFVNHSCQPNCEMQKWSVNGQFRMALFALRDINSQEELTYDYNFSLFNPAEGQECKCGSDMCRGVIGGKSQRVRQLPSTIEQQQKNNGNNSGNNGNNINNNNNNNGRVGRPRKNQAKRTMNNLKDLPIPQQSFPVVPTPQVKPISHQQKCFILEHHCFLLRNLSKVRKLRDRSNSSTTTATTTTTVSRQQSITPTNQTTSSFINHLNALQKPRNIRTRRLAQAEDDPELNKTVKLASVLKDILNIVIKSKDDNNELIGNLFLTLPTKRKVPEFYQRINEPIDLNTIEQNIATGLYLTPESFDSDMNRLFTNFIRFYGRTHELGIAAIKLKKIYIEAKQQNLARIGDVLGTKPPPNFVSNKNKNEEEDTIRCICGLPRDEGLMIQCERCMVWQHSECVKADVNADSYHCEQCVPRDVDYEIPLDEFTEHGHRYYLTLLRGDLQLRQGDTVYVLRDIPIPGTDRKHTYDTIGKIDFTELDIFRIERLWKDSTNGQRFAYGHHYLRPHETYHEPTRKFFSNEVMRVPLYEAVPVELIIQHCWVMDINTYCKGRPIGAPEEHIYICEYRVDKSARLFSKVSKSKFPICTKSFAFEKFEQRLKISRTYTPHDLDPSLIKPRGRKPQDNDNDSKDTVNNNHNNNTNNNLQQVNVPVIRIRTPVEQKARLNKILLNLLSKMPTKQVLDVSYLLEGGRRRKKQQIDSTTKN